MAGGHKKDLQKNRNDCCLVCGSSGARWHYNGLCCARCRVFFIRCSRLGKPLVCPLKGNCVVTIETKSFCAACRLKKCLNVGMKLEDVGVAKKVVKNVVNNFKDSETALCIHNIGTSLAVYGPKVISHLDGATTATEFATTYSSFIRFIDGYEGPSPSVNPVNLNMSIYELLLNPGLCASRSTSALDQMCMSSMGKDFTYYFDRSYGRIATSYADLVMSLREMHELHPVDKFFQLRLLQYNFVDYMIFKSIFIIYKLQQEHRPLLEFLSKQTVEGAPKDFLMKVNSSFISFGRTVEKVFNDTRISENEFTILLIIAMFSSPPTLTPNGANTTRKAIQRLTVILSDYIAENNPLNSHEENIKKLRQILGTISLLKEIAQIFAKGLVLLVSNNWGNMRGRLAMEFHLKEF